MAGSLQPPWWPPVRQACAKFTRGGVRPGSRRVVAAKRLLSDVIDTGTRGPGPARPSSLQMKQATPALLPFDLFIEAWHGEDSSAFLVTTSAHLADVTLKAIPVYWHHMGAVRVGLTKSVLSSNHGGIILAKDTAEAMALINDYAPEHLQILSKETRKYLAHVGNAGEFLLGEHTPSTLGNFVLGPSHVLPTNGWAKSFSAISVNDFTKRTPVVEVTSTAYDGLSRHAPRLPSWKALILTLMRWESCARSC
jgi:histidinol dehydrogenase